MSAKRVFFGALQKIMVVCCAIFFGFANAFSANLPAGYQQVEYIESNGTQYFDTGIVGKSGVSVEAKFMLATDANGSLFGNRQSDSTRFWPAMWFKNTGSSVWQWDVTVNVDTLAGTVNKNTLYTTYFVSNSSGWTLDVNGERVSSGTQVGTNTNNMWMFGTNDGRTNTLQYPFIGKAYYAKIWQNGTLVRDFIPVKDSNEKFGMYDLVSNRFYPSASSTQFTGGTPVIGSACNNNTGVLSIQQNLLDSAIVRYKGCLAVKGTYPYSDTETQYLNVFFNVEPNTSYTYTTTTAGTRDGIYEYNNVFNPDDYTQEHQIVPDMVIQSGTTSGKYASGTFTTSADAKMIMYYGSNDWPTTPKGLTIYPTNRPIGTVYCDTTYPVNGIKIATTAYNAARFNSVQTDLNNAVATIREIVTKTINQTAAIASLQADKQTRPEDACPAGKKCLLVETEENGVVVPHWFPIIENIYGLPAGYTPLEYLNNNGTAWLNLGIPIGTTDIVTFDLKWTEIANGKTFFGGFDSGGSYDRYSFVGTYSSGNTKGFYSDGTGMYNFVATANTRYLIKWNGVGQNPTYNGNNFTRGGIPNVSFTPHVNAYLFTRNEAGDPGNVDKLIMYSFKVERDGQNIMNLVPAKRDSDSVLGMYDTVNDRFYTNAGTGTFTAGPEI